MTRIPRALVAVLTVLGAIAACSGSGSGEETGIECPQDLPKGCASPAPSFAGEVAPIFDRRCNACHAGAGRAAASHDFSTYDAIYRQRSAVLNQVYACKMPPPGATPPTPDERDVLLRWLVCGAPKGE